MMWMEKRCKQLKLSYMQMQEWIRTMVLMARAPEVRSGTLHTFGLVVIAGWSS